MTNNNPIGVFDSGIGGLSIAKKVRDILKNENIIYVADTRHAPYGEKSDEFICQRAIEISDFLIERGAKAILVACNTATTSAIQKLRATHNIPFIGVEPGTKPAALNSKCGKVGVLATSRTLVTESFERLVKRTSGPVSVELQACPELVLQVEALNFDGVETIEAVNKYLAPLLQKGVDHIVLGCTHFNYLETTIAKAAGPAIKIVNTAQAVANEVLRQLEKNDILNGSDEIGNNEFWTSGSTLIFSEQIETLWGECVEVHRFQA